jgi:hypothetical protein
MVGLPAAFTIVKVLVALNTGFRVELPTTNPLTGAVSLPPAASVSVTGPDMAVTALRPVSALARLV